MNALLNQHVLILGLGASGLAMARWCVQHGAHVQVWDSRAAPPQAAALAAECPAAIRVTGELAESTLHGIGWVLKSPGLAPHDERIAPLLAGARAAGIRVSGEIDLFVQALADLKTARAYAPEVLAITGTNGKTTTTALTALLVARAGRSVVAAGNIGPTLLDTLAAHLAADSLPQVWAIELSSFQLDAAQGFEPAAAVVLNLTQDHLDWHGDMAAYTAAKACVYGNSAVMVVNRDDIAVAALEPQPAPAPPARADGSKPPRSAKAVKFVPRTAIRFGLDAPQRPGDFGLVVEHGMAWLVRALPAEEGIKRRKGEEPEIHLQRLMPADALRLRGRHNTSNALAALALATAIGCTLAPMLHGLREYTGEPHRVQPVGHIGEVEAFDDSKGTNVGATVAALTGLGADIAPGRLAVILGGDGKGQDFAPLAAPVAAHARAVALIGRDAPVIAQALADAGVPTQHHPTLEAATRWCFAQAQAGDAVLLSPACASLDMFRDYAHRAEVFVSTVQALAAEAGGVPA